MTVKIITDSCSDLPEEEAKRLGIILVPTYVRFGDRIFREGVDLSPEDFYRKLTTDRRHPSTAAPSPGEYAAVYEQALKHTNQIVSIHITGKESVAFNAALLGRDFVARDHHGCQIEVIDSLGVSVWTGLVAVAAQRAADAGLGLHDIVDRVHETILGMKGMALLNTAAYVARGGRLGKAIASVESVISVRPLLTLRDGELRPSGFVRTRARGIDRIKEFVRSARHIEDIAFAHAMAAADAEDLAAYASTLRPGLTARTMVLGPAIGAHGGPGALIAAINQTKPDW